MRIEKWMKFIGNRIHSEANQEYYHCSSFRFIWLYFECQYSIWIYQSKMERLDCQYLDIFFIRNDLDYISFFDLVPTVKSCSTKRNHHHHQCLSAFQIVSQDILGAYSHKIKPSVHFRIWFKFCKRISFPMRIFRLNSIKRFLQNSSTNRYMLVRSSFITLGISLNVWNYFASLFQLNHGEQVFLGSTKLIVLEKNSIRFFCSECNYFFRFLVFS